MSKVAPDTPPSGLLVSLENLLFDFPGADVILRSCDSYEFRVLKLYIFHSSPVLGEIVLTADSSQSGTADTAAATLPVVQLSDSGAILFSLLTYIFPVQPILPSTVAHTMALLSAAQTYKMDVTLAHIRNHIAHQHPPFIREDNSLSIYSLAQKHGLRREMLQAARSTLGLPTLTIDNLHEKLELMPGAFLHELWKYHQRVRVNLTSDLQEFITSSHVQAMFDSKGPSCRIVTSAPGVPSWLGQYISSIGRSPHLFDLSRFYVALTGHIQSLGTGGGCRACATIPGKSILEFWPALSVVYRDSISKAESDLVIVEEDTNFESHANLLGGSLFQPRYTDMPDADVILRSSDLVNFRVQRSILKTCSPFFDDLFSLPQPPGHEAIDGLPVVHLSEDAEVLNSLIALLYPVPPELPASVDKILTLLSACQKYDMTAVQSSIREQVRRRGLLSPTGADSFRLFATACRKRLIPEMKAAARLTFGYPMTFEYLGEALKSFEGWALSDLAGFRRHCRPGITLCFKAFANSRNEPSKVWVGCPTIWRSEPGSPNEGENGNLPIWLNEIFAAKSFQRLNTFTSPLATPSSFREEYLKALRVHIGEKDCTFCMKTHTLKGEEFCAEIEAKLAQAWDVEYTFSIELPAPRSTPPSFDLTLFE